MAKINLPAEEIVGVFEKYCSEKNYQLEITKGSNAEWRLNISNIKDRTLVIIYHTGSIVIAGRMSSLKSEFQCLTDDFAVEPQAFVTHEIKEIRNTTTRYEIVSAQIRQSIRDGLESLDGAVEIFDKPTSSQEYRAKVTRNRDSLTITQFNTGVLLLQGKTDALFDEGCTWIEKIANPADKEVIARFISSDEESLKVFSAKYTQELLKMAEENVRKAIGSVYVYVESYDQKWFVASECLCLSEIPLPEFSPLVMPASKAFEGFAKKLLVDVGLFEVGYFERRDANFRALSNRKDTKRRAICDKDRHADTMLQRLRVCLDTNRNFMMHSDSSTLTKVDSPEEAKEKLVTIFKDAVELFEYFNGLYGLVDV